jgi:hypothetical protein
VPGDRGLGFLHASRERARLPNWPALRVEYGERPGQIKLAAACAEAARIRALARDGVDWPAQEEARLRAEAAERELTERQDGLTLAKALREYVEKKRRAKDGLALKTRTQGFSEPVDLPNGGAAPGRTLALPPPSSKPHFNAGENREWSRARLPSPSRCVVEGNSRASTRAS